MSGKFKKKLTSVIAEKFTNIRWSLYHHFLDRKKGSLVQIVTVQDLATLAKDRLEDAKILYNAGRFWGAVYICGYAIELGLKKKICNTLDRNEYPDIKDLKTHKLKTLLILSGLEKLINTQFTAEWSIVKKWDPEQRYSVTSVNQTDAESMIKATDTLLGLL